MIQETDDLPGMDVLGGGVRVLDEDGGMAIWKAWAGAGESPDCTFPVLLLARLLATLQLPVVAWLYGREVVAGEGTVMLAGEQGVAVVWAMLDIPPLWLTDDAML